MAQSCQFFLAEEKIIHKEYFQFLSIPDTVPDCPKF